jgi:hypothetical protein
VMVARERDQGGVAFILRLEGTASSRPCSGSTNRLAPKRRLSHPARLLGLEQSLRQPQGRLGGGGRLPWSSMERNLTARPATEATASRQLFASGLSDAVVGRPCSASSTASART